MKALYGSWDMTRRTGRFPYGDDHTTYERAAEFLGSLPVEDWGCGGAWLSTFLSGEYRGIDGADAPWVDVHADLRTYTSTTPAAHLRHVLEHNWDWRDIMENFMGSFTERAVVTTFVPFKGEGCPWVPCGVDVVPHDGDTDHFEGHPDQHPEVPDLHIPRDDLQAFFADVEWVSRRYVTVMQYGAEEVFFLTR